MILHIPHSSLVIPDQLRNQIVLSDAALSAELLLMTDRYTDELFSFPETPAVLFPVSRLIVDVERFPDDADEPMSKVGMGMVYTKTADGRKLKRVLLPEERKNLVSQYYDTHHQKLFNEVKAELEKHGNAMIVDCHSFPDQPLPSDLDQSMPRPEFCIGADSFHTPKALIRITEECIRDLGFSVGINRPYAGSIVPMDYYRRDRRVSSIMIEINRSLYMDDSTGEKTVGFSQAREHISGILKVISVFQNQM